MDRRYLGVNSVDDFGLCLILVLLISWRCVMMLTYFVFVVICLGLNTCLCLGGCGVVYLSLGVARVWCFLSVSFGRCCLVVVA